MQKRYDGKAIKKSKISMAPYKSGSFNPSKEAKSGTGTNGDGSVAYLSKIGGADQSLTEVSESGKGPGVDKSLWTKAGDHSLTTG